MESLQTSGDLKLTNSLNKQIHMQEKSQIG